MDDAQEGANTHGELRGRFWAFYVDRFPAEAQYGRATKAKSRWTPLGARDLVISQYTSIHGVGLFMRGPRGEPLPHTFARLEDVWEPIQTAFPDLFFAEPTSHADGFLMHGVNGDLADPLNWPWMAEWLKKHRDEWIARLRLLLKEHPLPAPG